jgi:hypothetical protein
MRAVIRLLVLIGLVVSSAALTPLAVANTPTPSAGASASTSPGDEPSASSDPADESGSSAATPSPTAGPTAGTAKRTAGKAIPDPNLKTTIDTKPATFSTTVVGKFTFHATGSTGFLCTVYHKGMTPSTTACGGVNNGSYTNTRLKASHNPYQFNVRAFTGTATAPLTLGPVTSYRWRIYSSYAPDHYLPSNGATFNTARSSASLRRRNLTRAIRTINSMPGYRQAYPGGCPTAQNAAPGVIRVTMYSIFDRKFASSLINANRRCLSVQVLMNNHLNKNTDPAWRALEKALRPNVYSGGQQRRSFAHRCNSGCRGGGVMHTKMLLFDSRYPVAKVNKIRDTVMFGSTNMTSNATNVQYNDLYAVRNRPTLFSQFSNMFNLMKKDNGYHRNPTTPYKDGPYETTFWPVGKGATDPYTNAFRSIHCTGANGGTGTHGRTIVYINMHAWFGTRGLSLANQVKTLYNKGCYVRILYSFMSYGVFKKLHNGTNSRMSVRRTLFSRNGRTAYIYSHFKNIAVSGYVRSDRSAKVVWTGSNNFTNEGTNFDEVMVRINSWSTYNSYVKKFAAIRKRQSSTKYASFSEPSGGGRAPKRAIAGRWTSERATAPGEMRAPSGTPVITVPGAGVDASGNPYVTD